MPNSFHLRGRAADFGAEEHTLIEAARTARTLRVGARCTGPEEVVLEKLRQPGMHLHVAW